uniref:Uncharacterized protein n=1 Tax=Panthera tigris altaica TaxID=74533 RepID=A0A8C9JH24_PANTA
MGSQGFILLVLLLILAVLCHSGHSLTCYSCVAPVSGNCTKTSVCSSNLDSCLYIEGSPNPITTSAGSWRTAVSSTSQLPS